MIIFIVVGAIFLLALFGAGFVSASPREIKVISGCENKGFYTVEQGGKFRF